MNEKAPVISGECMLFEDYMQDKFNLTGLNRAGGPLPIT